MLAVKSGQLEERKRMNQIMCWTAAIQKLIACERALPCLFVFYSHFRFSKI